MATVTRASGAKKVPPRKLTPTQVLLAKMKKMGKISERVASRVLGQVGGGSATPRSTQLHCCGMVEVELMGKSLEAVHRFIVQKAQGESRSLFILSVSQDNTAAEAEIPGMLGAKRLVNFVNRRTNNDVQVFALVLESREEVTRFVDKVFPKDIGEFTQEDVALLRKLAREGYAKHAECWHGYTPSRTKCDRCKIMTLLGRTYQ